MKDSGIAWVGEIPDNWETSKIKHKLETHFGGCWGDDCKNDDINNGYLCIRVADFNFYNQTVKNDANTIRQYTKKQVLENQLINGDIILEKSGGGEKTPVGRTVLYNSKQFSNQTVLFANFCECLRPKNICNQFLAYYLKSFYYANDMHLFFNQTTGIQNLNVNALLNQKIPLPPIAEQERIAEFLDGKCGEIDGLINDIKTQIETLEQYKRSVITEAVTKGLNKSAPLKDSGIPWIGTIPKNWKCVKGKYLFAQRNLRGNKIELQLLSPSQRFGVIPQTVYEELTTQVVVKVKDNTNLSLFRTVHKGDFCISLRSFQGGFEYSAYEGVVSPAYTIFYPIINICDGYYKRLFKENSFIEIINSYALSLRDGKNISFEDFGKTYIPYPPINEQKQIADYLDKKCAEIDKIISDKQSQIETLEEYKKSLIFEYVTGKKQVE